MIPFDTTNVEPSKTPDYVLEYACFKMDVSMSHAYNKGYHEEDVRAYTIETHTLKSRVLKHTYLCIDAYMRRIFRSLLNSFALLKVRALDPAKRPANYDEIMRNPSTVRLRVSIGLLSGPIETTNFRNGTRILKNTVRSDWNLGGRATSW